MGTPYKLIRLMVSLLILKNVRNLSNENLVEQWSENIYYQYFSGNDLDLMNMIMATDALNFNES